MRIRQIIRTEKDLRSDIHRQTKLNINKVDIRMPAVAGTFYPGTASSLKEQLVQLFSVATQATRDKGSEIAALIVPHAGYVYSGEVAAAAYARLDREQPYQNIFLIGASHHKLFPGVCLYPKGSYATPLGNVEINEEITTRLMENHSFITYDKEVDIPEHSLEVQLPFLQYWLLKPFKIVPLIIGTEDPKISIHLASALSEWFNGDNLFVISTDFSHYPNYPTAVATDAATAEAIVSNNPEKLKRCCEKNKNAQSTGLLTGLCGAAAVQTLLYLTYQKDDLKYEKLIYKNSGDKEHGNRERVVGYWAIALKREKRETQFSKLEKEKLLSLARDSIKKYLEDKKYSTQGIDDFPVFRQQLGAFVSIHNGEKLRGCIGRFNPQTPLYQTIAELAIAAAASDSRFEPVTKEELSAIKIEISILTPLKKIEDIEEIELGKHGIYIKKGDNSGTYLPQVANTTHWTIEQFLGHCARDKAGIGWDGWRTANLYTYEAIVFQEK